MKRTLQLLLVTIFSLQLSARELQSPDGNLQLRFSLSEDGRPFYELLYKSKPVIKPSGMGLELKNSPSLIRGFEIKNLSYARKDETWTPVWGETKEIRNQYN